MKKKKIQITEKQANQLNYMLHTLRKISKAYQTPAQLRRGSEKEYGLDYEECLEMAYENIQGEPSFAAKGIKPISLQLKKEYKHKNGREGGEK